MQGYDAIAPTQRDKTSQITSWLGQLARTVRHQQQLTQQQRANMVAEYTEMLLRSDIPASAYCLDALSAVTSENDWWPPVGALKRLLEEFALVQRVRSSNARQPLQISGGTIKARELSETDKNWLRSWQGNEQMNWNLPDEVGSTDQERAGRRKIWLSMLKRYAPAVYEMVTGVSLDRVDPSDWKDAARVRRSVQNIEGGPCQRYFFEAALCAVTRHAPENISIVEEAMKAARV